MKENRSYGMAGLFILPLLTLLLVMTACAQEETTMPPEQAAAVEETPPAAEAEPEPDREAASLVVAYPTTALAYAPFFLADERGFFADEDLDVRGVQMQSSAAHAGLVSGDVDISLFTSAIRPAMRGLPVKMIAFTISQNYMSLFVTPEIESVEDLRGKAVGITGHGGLEHYVTEAILQAHSVDPSQVTIVATGGTHNTVTALVAGQLDAAVLGPDNAPIVQKAGLRPIAAVKDYLESGQGGIATAERLITERPDLVERFLRGLMKGLRFLTEPETKDEAIDYFATFFEVSREDAATIYEGTLENWARDGKLSEGALRFEIALNEEALEVSGIEPDDVADFRFIDEVVAGFTRTN